MAKTKTLPCPFCGGKGKVKNMLNVTYYVECEKCSASTGMYIAKPDALDAWNKRDGVSVK